MGPKQSKQENTKELPNTPKSSFLLLKRCIFLTQEQYKNQDFIPNNSYSIKGYSSNVDSFVISSLSSLGKVPAPIYVMYAKKLQYKDSIFGSCMTESIKYNEQENIANQRRNQARIDYQNRVNTTNADRNLNFFQKILTNLNHIKTLMNDNINISNDLANFLKTQCPCLNKPENKDKIEQYKFMSTQLLVDPDSLNNSNFSIFDFGTDYEIYIFIPNLNKDGRYISNLYTYSLTNQWMKNLATSKYYFNILSFIETDSILRKFRRFIKDENTINKIKSIIIGRTEELLPFIRESNNACYDNGCVSDFGEDFVTILPGSYKDEDAIDKKAPFFPTKCLKRFNYDGHMFKADTDYNNKLKEKLLGDCFKDYKDNFDKVNSGDVSFEKDSSTSLLEQFKKCAQDFKYEEKGKKPEEFSKGYNKNIMIELAKRNNNYPGIQENSLQLHRVNVEHSSIKPYITYMPWGNKLIGLDYVINIEQDPLYEGYYISSFNENFKLFVAKNGYIILLRNNQPYYLLNNKNFSNVYDKHLVLENGYLVLKGFTRPKGYTYGANNIKLSSYIAPTSDSTNSNGNLIQLWRLLVIDAEKANNPYSLIINDSGNIVIYDNGFNNTNSKELTDINNSMNVDSVIPDFNFDEYIKSLFDDYFTSTNNKDTSKDSFYSKDNDDSNKKILSRHELEIYKSRHPELTTEQTMTLLENPDFVDVLIPPTDNNLLRNETATETETEFDPTYRYRDTITKLIILAVLYDDIKKN